MATRIAMTALNASTMDILNTIRANGSYEYQSMVPEVQNEHDIPKVGDVLYGYPTLANQFVNALVNRIALVSVKSATFNNAYAELKKGYLEYGETVEEVFVSIAKAREFSAEKAEKREHKRSLPDVRTAFHAMNWRVQYPITIQDEELRMAFLSVNGVQDLIAKIVNAVYVASEYDEYLLFKYLLIKAITKGKMYPVSIGSGDMSEAAVAFRAMSNQLTFMSNKYNASAVTTTTQKKDQYIFMDSTYNAKYDVNVLAGAFNMEKADFIGKLKLIDDWTSFDNDRFSEIIENCDMIEEVTADELALMKDVKAVLVDGEWFQVYDNHNKFTEKYVASGEYWNYFFNVWKTISSSPFSNAVVFVAESADISMPASINVGVESKTTNAGTTVITLAVQEDDTFVGGNANFVQTENATKSGVAIHKYGAVIIPEDSAETNITLEMVVNGVTYTGATAINTSIAVGSNIVFNK